MKYGQSFSALNNFSGARAQNVLSAAQFCAHFQILESFISNLTEQLFREQTGFCGQYFPDF